MPSGKENFLGTFAIPGKKNYSKTGVIISFYF